MAMCEKCGTKPRMSTRRKRCEDCDPWCRMCEVAERNGGSNYCRSCQAARRREWYANDPANREARLASNRAGSEAMKAEVRHAYGDACTCCGTTEPQFLTLDHVDNDGAEERRETGLFGGNPVLALRAQPWLPSRSLPTALLEL